MVSNGLGSIGKGSSSAGGEVTVSGSGSRWTNTGALEVGVYASTSGALRITDGGSVTTTDVSVASEGLLAIEVNGNSGVTVANGSGRVTNDGTVRIIAGAAPAAGVVYTPIAANTWDGSGTYEALGGRWNAAGHVFTASTVVQGASGTPLGFDRVSSQRVLVSDVKKGWSVGASFLATQHSSWIDFTATAVSGDVLADLEAHMDSGESVLGGWDFTTEGNGAGEPVYLSFDIGPGQSWDDLQVWHYDGAAWQIYDAADLTYDGTYACFTVDDFSGYAVAPVKNVWMPGDANGDNRVDEADARIVAAHWGTSSGAAWGDGDFNGDGLVNASDASILAANWGCGTGESTTVPEPGVLGALLGTAWLVLLGRRERRV